MASLGHVHKGEMPENQGYTPALPDKDPRRPPMIQINVNGKDYAVDAEPSMPLLWVLRDVLGMTGTKYGCGIAQCGACTVHVNGAATRSCVAPVGSLTADQKVVTIEGLSPDASHP